MSNFSAAEICYMVLIPLQTSLPTGVPSAAQVKKDIPYFFDLDIEFLTIGEQRLNLNGYWVEMGTQVLDEEVWVAECRFHLPNVFSETAAAHKQALQTALKHKIQQDTGYNGSFIEEYVVVLLHGIDQTPDDFIGEYGPGLARLLRSVEKPLTDLEISKILEARARYAEDDLMIVDWDGAVVIAGEHDFQSEIELLKIGNYQLLRYRLLDQAIDLNLETLRRQVARSRPGWLSPRRKILKEIIEQRLTLLLDFETIDQDLLLIGDWYSSEVYRLIVDQFYLDEWKISLRNKLDTLTAIDEAIRHELAFSWERFLDFIEISGWLILLVGYFVLFFVESGWFD